MTSPDLMMPHEAGKFISEHSEDVKISAEGVSKVAAMLSLLNPWKPGVKLRIKMQLEQRRQIHKCVQGNEPVIHADRWKTHALNPKTEDQAAIDWVFLSDVGNFSFWSDDPDHRYTVTWLGQKWTGYWSWCAAINRALEDGIPITSAQYLRDLTEDQLRKVLRSDSSTEMPMIKEMLEVLREAGRVLVEKYDGTFLNAVTKSNKSAQALLQIVVEDFPSFRDFTIYKDKKVGILKRVQILIADIWASCGGRWLGEFSDISSITMFADYRIPQMLAWFGALEYSEPFLKKMKEGHMFKSGDREEIEIRGCTIWAVELIVEEVKKLMKNDPTAAEGTEMNSILVDHYLWDYRRDHSQETDTIPIHRVRYIYY